MTSGAASPWAPAPPPSYPRPSLRQDVTAAAVTLLAMVLLGAPLGVLWAHVAPRVQLLAQDGDVRLAQFETKAFIAGDGWFMALTFLAGIVAGSVAFWLGRQHGAVLALALAAGGVLAAAVAWRVGLRVGLESMEQFLTTAQDGDRGEAAVELRARGALVAWGLAAVGMYFCLLLAVGRDRMRSRLS